MSNDSTDADPAIVTPAGGSRLDAELIARHRAARYIARSASGEVTLVVGQACPAVDAWLACVSRPVAALVTAANPRGEVVEAEENALRHERLRAHVSALGWPFLEAEGTDHARDNVAPALLVGLPHQAAAERLGRSLDQNAVVIAVSGMPVRLMLLV